MNVKVCGITNEDDARMAALYGADVIGVIVDVPVQTPRKITKERARRIRESLVDINHSFVTVLMPESLDEVTEVFEHVRPDGIQLHGREPLDLLDDIRSNISCHIIKAFHSGQALDPSYVIEASKKADMVLVDTQVGNKIGGTGEGHERSIDLEVKKLSNKRLLASGGINPENVSDVVKRVMPYGVDVSSGVESSPGKKDPELVRRFIEVSSCL